MNCETYHYLPTKTGLIEMLPHLVSPELRIIVSDDTFKRFTKPALSILPWSDVTQAVGPQYTHEELNVFPG